MAPIVACGIICTTLFLLSYVVYQACECVSDPHTWQALPTMYASACTSCKKSTNLQESNSGKQHYLRAMFTRAGSYCLAGWRSSTRSAARPSRSRHTAP